jgi:hypothetical protein
MGERARAHAAVDFSVERAVGKYVELYRRTLQDCRE